MWKAMEIQQAHIDQASSFLKHKQAWLQKGPGIV